MRPTILYTSIYSVFEPLTGCGSCVGKYNGARGRRGSSLSDCRGQLPFQMTAQFPALVIRSTYSQLSTQLPPFTFHASLLHQLVALFCPWRYSHRPVTESALLRTMTHAAARHPLPFSHVLNTGVKPCRWLRLHYLPRSSNLGGLYNALSLNKNLIRRTASLVSRGMCFLLSENMVE
jgi:hypothetical protein